MTLPNKLTLLRILLAPLFAVAVFWNNPWAYLAAFILLTLAALTDLIDGHIARKTNSHSAFGRFADPLADKLYVLTALFSFVALGAAPLWPVLLILWREMIVTTLRAYASHRGVEVPSSKLGKAKTMLQMIAVLAILAHLTLRSLLPHLGIAWGEGLDYWWSVADYALLGIAAAQALISGIVYIWNAREVIASGLHGDEK